MARVCSRCGDACPADGSCESCGHHVTTDLTLPIGAVYRPSAVLLIGGVALWLLTLPLTLPHGKPAAYLMGAIVGGLIIPAIVRVVWTALTHRGPQLWERALFSPWLWVVAAGINVMTAGGRHPQG